MRQIPVMKNLIDSIEEHARNNPSKNAIITKNDKLTFNELSRRSSLFANSLKEFSTDSIISLFFDNSINFVISYIGTLKAGLTAHILSPHISESFFNFQINSSNSQLVVAGNKEFDILQNINTSIKIKKFDHMVSTSKFFPKEIHSSHFAHLLYTSGTTSEPKGVAITHSNLIFTTQNIVSVLDYDSSDVSLLPLPLHHSFGLGCLNTSLYSGGQLVLLNNASELSYILQAIKKFNITTFAAVPATLIKLLKFHYNEVKKEFPNLRLIITNSTSIPPKTVLEFKRLLRNGHIATYYGLTEASRSSFMIFEKNLEKDESVGKPAPKVKIKIENMTNNIGEIWIKGPNVIKQYWNNPEADQNIVNGWLKTGDLGYFDNDNFLYLAGRLDDVINVGGEKVFPEHVERIIKKMSNIEEVVVVGQKHEIFGQTVKAFVKLSSNCTLKKSDILSFCIKNLEKYMVPTKIEFVNEFPLTEYGKIKRFMLKSGDDSTNV